MNPSSQKLRKRGQARVRDRLTDLPAPIKWGALAVALLIVAFVGWLGSQGLVAKSNLEQARANAQQSKDALLGGNTEDAIRQAENAQLHATQARAAVHSLPWNIAAAVPFLGSPLKTTQQISDVVVGLADDVLLPGAKMGAGLSPDKLIDGTRLNLGLLRAEQTPLTELAAAAARLDFQAEAISNPAYLSLIRNALSQLQDQTSKLAQLLGNTARAAQLAPSMLGADGPRTYLLGFQNNAEARGTGGLLGGFGILRFNNGEPNFLWLTNNVAFQGAKAPVDLGPEFNSVYGWTNPYTDFRNSNMSPHFPYAAQIWESMWESRSPERIDGVMTVDPIVLSYVLGAIGPVTLPDGQVVDAENVVELTESTAYNLFPDDTLARKSYLQEIAGEVVKKMTGPIQSPRRLLDALGRGASERRISVWSVFPAEQKLLEETPLAHVVPDDDAPYAQVIINNLSGNKMDYYLEREIEYVADGCDGDKRNSTVTVRLTNTAEDAANLPDYVAGTLGLAPQIPINVPRGTMVTSVRLLATKGAKLISVTSNGERTTAITNVENGRPSFEVQVVVPPGQGGELTFRLSEPTSPGAPRAPVQPLIDNVTPKLSVPECN